MGSSRSISGVFSSGGAWATFGYRSSWFAQAMPKLPQKRELDPSSNHVEVEHDPLEDSLIHDVPPSTICWSNLFGVQISVAWSSTAGRAEQLGCKSATWPPTPPGRGRGQNRRFGLDGLTPLESCQSHSCLIRVLSCLVPFLFVFVSLHCLFCTCRLSSFLVLALPFVSSRSFCFNSSSFPYVLLFVFLLCFFCSFFLQYVSVTSSSARALCQLLFDISTHGTSFSRTA